MFEWIKLIVRDFKKQSIKKKFDKFSKFKGQSRVEEFNQASETLKSIERFFYRGESLERFIASLDCITIDEGWHIDMHYYDLFKNGKSRYPFLYCYKDVKPNEYDWKKVENLYTKSLMHESIYKIKSNPYNIYNHINVKPTEMGAWQVYLLELYPFIKNRIDMNDTERETTLLLISNSELDFIKNKCQYKIDENIDIRPYVWLKGNKAYVSCCRWVYNDGLGRDIYTIVFDNSRVKDIIKDYESLYCSHIFRS